MTSALLLLGSIAGLVALVPLCVLAATGGNWSRAWQALREYSFSMALIVVPTLVVVIITLLPRLTE